MAEHRQPPTAYEVLVKSFGLPPQSFTSEERRTLSRIKLSRRYDELDPEERAHSLAFLFQLYRLYRIGHNWALRRVGEKILARRTTAGLFRLMYAIILSGLGGSLYELELRAQELTPSKTSADRHSKILLNEAGKLVYGIEGHPQIPSLHLLHWTGSIHPDHAERIRAGEEVHKKNFLPKIEVACCGHRIVIGETSTWKILHAYCKIFSCMSPYFLDTRYPPDFYANLNLLSKYTGYMIRRHLSHLIHSENIIPVLVYNHNDELAGRSVVYIEPGTNKAVIGRIIGPVSNKKKLEGAISSVLARLGYIVDIPRGVIPPPEYKGIVTPEEYERYIAPRFEEDDFVAWRV